MINPYLPGLELFSPYDIEVDKFMTKLYERGLDNFEVAILLSTLACQRLQESLSEREVTPEELIEHLCLKLMPDSDPLGEAREKIKTALHMIIETTL